MSILDVMKHIYNVEMKVHPRRELPHNTATISPFLIVVEMKVHPRRELPQDVPTPP